MTIAAVISGCSTSEALLYACAGLNQAVTVTAALNGGVLPPDIPASIKRTTQQIRIAQAQEGTERETMIKILAEPNIAIFEDVFPAHYAAVTGRVLDNQEVSDITALMRHYGYGEPHYLSDDRVTHATELLANLVRTERDLVESNRPSTP